MFWWQQLLVCIGMGIAGIPVGFLIYKVWTWYDSRKGKSSISDNISTKFDILVKESRNQYHEDNQIFTNPAKSKEQTLSFVYENKHLVTKQETNLETNHRPEEIKIEREEVNRTCGEETLLVYKEREFTQEKSQLMLELEASTQKYQEAKANMLIEIERLSRGEIIPVTAYAVKKVEQEAEIVRKNQELKAAGLVDQAPVLKEIEINLRIATAPWDGKPLPFQTKIWNTKMVEFDSLTSEDSDNLGQAYMDMIMANDIVWFCTEIGHASDDLEASYKQLCNKIAERLDMICGKRYASCYV